MGQAESKLKLRGKVFKLGEINDIDPQDPYWSLYWREPTSVGDVFEFLRPADIRSIRDSNRLNFLLLIRIIALRFVYLATNKRFPSAEAPQRELLNCVRVLTRILPFLYEAPELSDIEISLFWSNKKSANKTPKTRKNGPIIRSQVEQPTLPTKSFSTSTAPPIDLSDINERLLEFQADGEIPLGIQLVQTCVEMLFTRKFTVEPSDKSTNEFGQEYSIWEPGIGYTSEYKNPKTEYDSNRLEILRFIHVLCSQCIYQTPSQVATVGSRYLTVLVGLVPRLSLLNLLCSLLNTTCRISKAGNENGLFLHSSSLSEIRYLMVTYATQLLTMMVVYPIPKNHDFLTKLGLLDQRPHNMVRYYFGKLHKDNELIFLESGLLSILKKPISSTSEAESSALGIIKGTNKNNEPSIWSTEVVMLLWELFQCNKKFRVHAGEKIGSELPIILTYYIFTYRNVPAYKNFIRICSYFLLFLSSDPIVSAKILAPIDSKIYNGLPANFKVNPTPITYRDFIVCQFCFMLQNDDARDLLAPTYVEILYNFIPLASNQDHIITNTPSKSNRNPGGGLNYAACVSLNQLVTRFSTNQVLSANTINADLLALLLRAICHYIIKYPRAARTLLFLITKGDTVYNQVLSTINNFDSDSLNQNLANLKIANNSTDSLGSDIDPKSTPLSRVSSVTSMEYTNNEFSKLEDITEGQKPDEYEFDESLLRPKRPAGMSEKAKSKLPIGAPLKRGWGGMEALQIILSIIPKIRNHVPEVDNRIIDVPVILAKIEQLDFDEVFSGLKLRSEYQPGSKIEPLKFVWSTNSLGWYESILWGCIFSSNDVCKNSKIFNNLTNSISSFNKISNGWLSSWSASTKDVSTEVAEQTVTSVNVWLGTNIKLFKIQLRSSGYNFIQNGYETFRKLSDYRGSNRNSVSSIPTTPVDEVPFPPTFNPRHSLTPRHSFTKGVTPGSNRNSISM